MWVLSYYFNITFRFNHHSCSTRYQWFFISTSTILYLTWSKYLHFITICVCLTFLNCYYRKVSVLCFIGSNVVLINVNTFYTHPLPDCDIALILSCSNQARYLNNIFIIIFFRMLIQKCLACTDKIHP